MSIPQKIAERLHAQGIHYQIIETAGLSPLHPLHSGERLPAAQIVQVAVLEDKLGRLQVLLPSDCLLDLPRLNDHKSRNLTALGRDACRKLASSLGVDSLPSLPLSDNLPLEVDRRLLKQPILYLQFQQSNQFLALSQSEFARLVEQGDIADFCIPLSRLGQPADDRKAVDQAVQQFTRLRIKQRLEQTLEMPPLPDTAERIIKLRIDPNASVKELSAVVEKDPSLAAQVVSWASSPYYAAPGAIRSVHDAVMRVLGFDLVINLALGLSLSRSIELPKDGPDGVLPYWQQAVYSASLMEGLVKALPADYRPSMGLSYLCGLLSNYGHLVLAHVFPPYFSAINRCIEANPHVERFYVDQHLVNVTRETIASQLMECWSMPSEVVTGLRWQHHPDFDGEFCVYSRLMFVTNQLLRSAGLSLGPLRPLEDSLLAALHLNREDALAALDKVVKQKDDLMQIASGMGG